MRRVISQKVDSRAIPTPNNRPTAKSVGQFLAAACCKNHPSAALVGLALVAGTAGVVMPQQTATAAFPMLQPQIFGVTTPLPQQFSPLAAGSTIASAIQSTHAAELQLEPNVSTSPSPLVVAPVESAEVQAASVGGLTGVQAVPTPQATASPLVISTINPDAEIKATSSESNISSPQVSSTPEAIASPLLTTPSPEVEAQVAAPDLSLPLDQASPTPVASSPAVISPESAETTITTTGTLSKVASPTQTETVQSTQPLQAPVTDTELAKVAIPNPLQETVVDSAYGATYQVKRGDTVERIAAAYQVSPQELITANHLTNPNLIQVNAVLKIPARQLHGNPNAPLTTSLKGNEVASSALRNYPIVESSLSSVSTTDRVEQNNTLLVAQMSLQTPQQSFASNQPPAGAKWQPAVATTTKSAPRSSNISVVQARSWVDKPRLQTTGQRDIVAMDTPQSPVTPSVSAPNNFYVPIAKRAIFPQIPRLELPPLSSVDNYLPRGLSSSSQFIWPAKGVLTSGYGPRWGRMHRGIDVAAPVGTPIVAAADGVVVTAGWTDGGYGNLVEVRHRDGSLTLYGHNNRVTAHTGQQVYQGEKIAEMGSTGRSTGPHSHFEIHPMGRGAVNPMIYLSRG